MNSEGNGPRSPIVIIAGKNLTHSCIVTLLWGLLCTKVTLNCASLIFLLLYITSHLSFNAETECEPEPRKYYALFSVLYKILILHPFV